MIRIHPDAHAEAVEAHERYLKASSAAAERFRSALADGYAKINSAPLRWPQDQDGFRRYKLLRFPYLIFFGLEAGVPHVLAVAHGARKPGYWRDRAK